MSEQEKKAAAAKAAKAKAAAKKADDKQQANASATEAAAEATAAPEAQPAKAFAKEPPATLIAEGEVSNISTFAGQDVNRVYLAVQDGDFFRRVSAMVFDGKVKHGDQARIVSGVPSQVQRGVVEKCQPVEDGQAAEQVGGFYAQGRLEMIQNKGASLVLKVPFPIGEVMTTRAVVVTLETEVKAGTYKAGEWLKVTRGIVRSTDLAKIETI